MTDHGASSDRNEKEKEGQGNNLLLGQWTMVQEKKVMLMTMSAL